MIWLLLLTLTGPGEQPWPQTQPSLVRLERLDLTSVVYYDADLAIGMRPSGTREWATEAVVWTPYYGTKRLADHVRGRGTWCPDLVDVAFATRVNGNLQAIAFAKGGSRWFVSFSNPEMFPCQRADFDCDGDVDQTDFGLLQRQLGSISDSAYNLDRDAACIIGAADVEVFRGLVTGAR